MRMCSVVPDTENYSNWMPCSCKNLTLRQTIKMGVALSLCCLWFGFFVFFFYQIQAIVLSAEPSKICPFR